MPSSKIRCFSLVCLSSLGFAKGSSFKPNCTLPPAGTNYVSGPNTRGTISILWNCLSVIFLCTWSIQHLNIPAMRPRPKTILQKAWWAILDFRTKIEWMIFTILIPEYILGKALNERIAVKEIVARFRNVYIAEWEEVHAYMSNMGYFVLDLGDDFHGTRGDDTNGGEQTNPSTDDPSKQHVERIEAHDSVLELGDYPPTEKPARLHSGPIETGFSLEKIIKNKSKLEQDLSNSGRVNLSRLAHRYWALTSEQMWVLINIEGLFRTPGAPPLHPPAIAARQLEALNRGDFFAKALALVQVTYLMTQLIARKLDGLPSAQLEIAALAFSASSMITYILCWNRPQGVESIHIMKLNHALSESEIAEVAARGPQYLWTKFRSTYKFEKELDLEPVPNDGMSYATNSILIPRAVSAATGSNDEIISLAIGALLGGTLFGGLHCLAWNFHFPTSGEALAWRICSVITSTLPSLSVVPMGVWISLNRFGGKPKGSQLARFAIGLILILVFLVPYVIARLFLVIEMFRSLFFLPPEAFVDTWSGSFPHWG